MELIDGGYCLELTDGGMQLELPEGTIHLGFADVSCYVSLVIWYRDLNALRAQLGKVYLHSSSLEAAPMMPRPQI